MGHLRPVKILQKAHIHTRDLLKSQAFSGYSWYNVLLLSSDPAVAIYTVVIKYHIVYSDQT